MKLTVLSAESLNPFRWIPKGAAHLPFLAAFLLGCSGADPEGAEQARFAHDSAGVEVIHVPAPVLDGIPVWKAGLPSLAVGADESHPLRVIGRVADASVHFTGAVVVGDGLAHRLVVFSGEGAYSHTIGREGSGPGDLRDIARVGVRGDTVFVLDRALRRLTRYRIDGEFLSSEQLSLPSSGLAQYRFGRAVRSSVFAYRVRVPEEFDPQQAEGSLEVSLPLEIWRFDQDAQVLLDSLAYSKASLVRLPPDEIRANVRRFGRSLILAAPIPALLAPTVEVGFHAEGAVLGFSDRFELRFLNSEGSLIRVLRVSVPRPTSDEDGERALLDWFVRGNETATRPLFERLARMGDVPDSLPHFYDLRIGEKGGVWLQLQPVVGGDGGDLFFRWLRLSDSGMPSGYFDVPGDVRILEFTEDGVLAVEKDSLDVEQVVFLPFVGSSVR